MRGAVGVDEVSELLAANRAGGFRRHHALKAKRVIMEFYKELVDE